MDKKAKEARETPIIDGDARPDMPIDPANERKETTNKKKPGTEDKFESERLSDLNSLEDYKDAKTDH